MDEYEACSFMDSSGRALQQQEVWLHFFTFAFPTSNYYIVVAKLSCHCCLQDPTRIFGIIKSNKQFCAMPYYHTPSFSHKKVWEICHKDLSISMLFVPPRSNLLSKQRDALQGRLWRLLSIEMNWLFWLPTYVRAIKEQVRVLMRFDGISVENYSCFRGIMQVKKTPKKTTLGTYMEKRLLKN